MSGFTETEVFNRADRFVEGWYWAMPSAELSRGAVKPLRLLGRDLAVWRSASGRVHAHDAYCPHMGAHLAEGSVDGEGIRCFFHHWKFDGEGELVDIPCQEHRPHVGVRSWHTDEQYGLIWIWAGAGAPHLPVPYIPELDGKKVRARLGNRFVKGCHPNVVMINAIDEQHFHSVHPLASSLAVGGRFDVKPLSANHIMFDNANPVPDTNVVTRLLGTLYDGPLTYRMVYWNGTTGSVTVGPDRQHFHIIFALRPNDQGQAEGQTILVTDAHDGPHGWLYDRACLRLAQAVGDYFAKGDTEVFQTIRWSFATPIKADRSIIHFIQHLEEQPVVAWGTWEPAAAARAEAS
ncbi:MAG TPA: aromatic ring-hydroxylating dioxygenase subunit alpha [Myxococcota bacterium]|nr:aromatic ring-hydroxylating dioxygenase subunit alpha [Myxococcota bacterium]